MWKSGGSANLDLKMRIPFNNSHKHRHPRQVCFLNAEQASLIHLSYFYIMQKSGMRGCARISPGICAWQPKTDVNYFAFFSPELLLNANEGCGVTLSFSLCHGKDSEGRCASCSLPQRDCFTWAKFRHPKNLAYLHISSPRGAFCCSLVQTGHKADRATGAQQPWCYRD